LCISSTPPFPYTTLFRSGFALCVLAFMAAACLSAVFSGNFHYALLGGNRYDGLVTLLLYGCIALGVSRWGQRRELYVNLTALARSEEHTSELQSRFDLVC